MRYLFLCFLVGCTHFHPELRGYNFTTTTPPETVEEAIEAAEPLVDETPILDLPYASPTQLRLSQSSPFPGILFSEYDAARYRILDESAETWRLRAITAEWRVARTEHRDAELIEALQERVEYTGRQALRRRRMIWVALGAGALIGVGSGLTLKGIFR